MPELEEYDGDVWAWAYALEAASAPLLVIADRES